MKTTTKKNSRTLFNKNETVSTGEHESNLLKAQDFTLHTPMTQEKIAPPTYLWDRISHVLDEQDRRKELEYTTLALINRRPRPAQGKLVYGVMGLTLIAGIWWALS